MSADAERRYQDAKAAIVAHAKSLGGTFHYHGDTLDAAATLESCRAMSRGREFVSRSIYTQRMERAAAAKAYRDAADMPCMIGHPEIQHLLRSRADAIEGGK